CASPLIRRGSSVRFTLCPTYRAIRPPKSSLESEVWSLESKANGFDSRLRTSDSRLLSRVLDGLDDVLVAGAAAQVSIEAVAYLFARGRRVAFEQLRGGHDHAGRAVAAL